MPLMFSRLAYNYAKAGYYPTDTETTARILNALAPAPQGTLRIFDPGCGEGAIAAEIKHHLGPDRTEAYGIEYDAERAWAAKTILDTTIHADLQDCVVGPTQFGCMLLNPPYGNLVTDQAHSGESNGPKRLEKLFWRRTISSLQFGGVLVLIVPLYTLDAEMANWIARQCEDIRVFTAAVDTYQQVVLFARKRRSRDASPEVREMLEAVGSGEIPAPELPEQWPYPLYEVPEAPAEEVAMRTARVDPDQLAAELHGRNTLWDQFDTLFGRVGRPPRRPLRELSPWHLGLVLAAGQVSGVVRSKEGRVVLIKGGTHKEKRYTQDVEEGPNGEQLEKRVATDVFVPAIFAQEFTPGSDQLGSVMKIQ